MILAMVCGTVYDIKGVVTCHQIKKRFSDSASLEILTAYKMQILVNDVNPYILTEKKMSPVNVCLTTGVGE